ncbi:MAG: hypothetical protein VKP62_12915 [Candidatus Sericytochromatia bacterium]|nr:hypothetical protein [Candidatus Sericytochromatia bacterium]
MAITTSSDAAHAWRIVKPNAAVPPRALPSRPVPLHFVAVPASEATALNVAEARAASLFQAAGPILSEVPLSSELRDTPLILGFTALRQA